MNFNLKRLFFIALAIFTLIGLSIGSKPKPDMNSESSVHSFNADKSKFPSQSQVINSSDREPLSLKDSIQQMENRLGQRIYEYTVEIETTPVNQFDTANNSGCNQYEAARKGIGYSKTWVKFYTDKQLSTKQAIQFAIEHPEKCIPIIPVQPSNEIDYYHDNLEEYQSDPENEIDFDPEIFDFMSD